MYLDTAGHEATAPCYDGIYQPNHYTDEPLVFARAAPLLSGYAVVSRDGKFGLLDSTGAELVPCAYDGPCVGRRHGLGSGWATAGTSTQFPA